jgi:hypothetical protein
MSAKESDHEEDELAAAHAAESSVAAVASALTSVLTSDGTTWNWTSFEQLPTFQREYPCLTAGIVQHIVDGDTMDVLMKWPRATFRETIRIRMAGMDAAETRTTDDLEKRVGLRTKTLLNTIAPVGSRILLWITGADKYAGRYVAHIGVPMINALSREGVIRQALHEALHPDEPIRMLDAPAIDMARAPPTMRMTLFEQWSGELSSGRFDNVLHVNGQMVAWGIVAPYTSARGENKPAFRTWWPKLHASP